MDQDATIATVLAWRRFARAREAFDLNPCQRTFDFTVWTYAMWAKAFGVPVDVAREGIETLKKTLSRREFS